MKHLFLIWLLFSPLFGTSQADGFMENNGQYIDQKGNSANDLLFAGTSNELLVQLYRDHFTYEIRVEDQIPSTIRKNKYEDPLANNTLEVHYSRVAFYFNGTPKAINKLNQSKTYYNRINPKGSFYKIKAFHEIIYEDVYPGIDIQFTLKNNEFKYNFILDSEANINDIQLEIKGGENIKVENQLLNIETENGIISEQIPVSYYLDENNVQYPTEIYYSLNGPYLSFGSSSTIKNDLQLIIDPVPSIIWGTYAGGGGIEYLEGVALDTNENINVIGFTTSTANIATTGAYDGIFDGVADILLMQYAPDGSKTWGTYFGGTLYDRGYGITVSADNSIYITGNTQSAGMATAGVQQTVQANGDEALISKFDDAGFLIWSTYYGGSLHDFGSVIAVDENNNTYVTGHTYSPDLISTAGAYQQFYSGASNAFISKFDDNGLLVWGTYFGQQVEEGWGIGLDSDANVYTSGSTQSLAGIASVGTHQNAFAGNNDAYLCKFDTDGNYLWGSYYGGSGSDQSYGLSVASDGICYMTGITSSPSDISYGNVYQPTPGSVADGFVAKFDPTGNIIWGTYIGGEGADYIYSTTFGPDSNIVVVGMTLSTQSIANSNSYDDSWNTLYDGFVISITQDADWRFGTYYGGEDHEELRDVKVDPTDFDIVLVGTTQSTTDMTTTGAEEEVFLGGVNDGVVARFCNPIFPKLDCFNSSFACDNNDEAICISNFTAFSSVTWSTAESTDTIVISGLTPGAYIYYVDAIDTNGCESVSDTIYFDYFETTQPLFTVSTDTVCSKDTLTAWTNDDYSSYLWFSGGIDTLDQATTFATPDSVAVYVDVIDYNGCSIISDTTWVQIVPSPNASINLTAISPYCVDDNITVNVATANSYSWNNGANTMSTSYQYTTAGFKNIIVTTSSGNCNDTDTLSIEIGTCDIGFSEFEDSKISIYPIPFTGELFISTNQPIHVSIYSMEGKLVFKKFISEANNTQPLNLTHLQAGVYTIILSDGIKSTKRRIVKE